MLRGRRLASLRPLLARAFAHTEMKRASEAIQRGSLPSRVVATLRGQVPAIEPQLKIVAKTFTDQQFERHEADYNLAKRYARREVHDLVDEAERAFAAWRTASGHDSASLYLVSLLVMHRVRGS